MGARYAAEPRVRPLGFTDQVPELFSAADALVHSTAGLTVLEAHLCGCPAISYGWGRGHIRAQQRAFRRFGLADVAETREQLGPALRRALAKPPSGGHAFGALPSAAARGARALRAAGARRRAGRRSRLTRRAGSLPAPTAPMPSTTPAPRRLAERGDTGHRRHDHLGAQHHGRHARGRQPSQRAHLRDQREPAGGRSSGRGEQRQAGPAERPRRWR